MEIETREIQRYVFGDVILNQFLVDEDYNVPDNKRDIQRIVASEGTVKIDELKPVENYICVSGKVEFRILYVGENLEPSLCCLEGKLPFEEMVYSEDEIKNYEVKSTRVELDATMIHSRKLRLRAMVELELQWKKQISDEIPTNIDCDVMLYKKTKPVELLKLYTSKRDMYRIKEEITLPGTKETIGNILWTDTTNRKMDTKLGVDEIQLSGELLVFCFYESPEGKIDWIEQAVSYMGRIECYGVDVSMYHQIQSSLEDVLVEMRMDEDGETRVIGIEGTLNINMVIYEEEKVEILEDVYSLEKQCKLEKKEGCYEQLLLQNHSKYKMREQLSLPELKNEVLQICHSSGLVQMEHVAVTEEGVLVEGVLHISFLYVKANDEVPFDTWHGILPFSYLIECNKACEDMKYHISGTLEQLSIGLLGGDDVEIKAVLAFQSFFRRVVNANMIVDLKMEPIDMKSLEKAPGVIGYIVKEEDDLWTLAKRYNTTMESIAEVNELDENALKPGERLLIFKENMGIL